MATIHMPDGQSFPLEDEMAATDDALRNALKVAYPDAANATFERSGGKDGKPLVIKVVKKAGTKGMEMSADEFNALFESGTPVRYHSIIGQPYSLVTKTHGRAWEAGGQVLVRIEGKTGAVAMEAISIDPALERYCRLGQATEAHSLDCFCPDCLAFLEAGLEWRATRQAEVEAHGSDCVCAWCLVDRDNALEAA